MRANRRDVNEREIVDFWRQMGCIWIPMVPSQGFDGLLIDRGRLYIVECKNPAVSWKLTPAEMELSRRVEDIGGAYHIIETVEAAAALIGLSVIP